VSTALRIDTASAIEIRVECYDWPFARERAEDIDAHWRQVCASHPRLFNGRVFLCRNIGIESGLLQGAAFDVGFKAFLAWRDFGFPDTDVYNCFAQGGLRAPDGAFILGEMAAGTSNAGRIYFPAGTPDPSDALDGRLDLDGSIMRELAEETGLASSDVAPGGEWTIVFERQMIACIKRLPLIRPREEILARIAKYLAAESAPELARVHVVTSRADIDAVRMPLFIQAYLERAFASSDDMVA
jgi:8-oxo-dGTP pyrophosphatase MutT (NUDIX family)